MPPQLIPRGIVTPGLLSHILISKFEDALPYYRQEKMFARLGVDLSRATMANWVIRAAGRMRVLIGLLENVGSYHERKQEALSEAQKTADISLLVKNLAEVKQLQGNKPTINPPDTHPIDKHALAILIVGEHHRADGEGVAE